MASPITWKNVNAPQISSGIANMMSQGNKGIQDGIAGLQGLASKQRDLNIAASDREMDNRTQMVVRDAMASKDPEAFLANIDPNQVNIKDVLAGIGAQRDYRQRETTNNLINQQQQMMNQVFMGNNANEQANLIARTQGTQANTAGQLKTNSYMDENQGMKRDKHGLTMKLGDQELYANGERNKVLPQQLQQGLTKGRLVNDGLGIDNAINQVRADYAQPMAEMGYKQAGANLKSTKLGNVMQDMKNEQEPENFRNTQNNLKARTRNTDANTASTNKHTEWIDPLNRNTLANGASTRTAQRASTAQGWGRLNEQKRSNKASEGIARYNAGTSRRRVNDAALNARLTRQQKDKHFNKTFGLSQKKFDAETKAVREKAKAAGNAPIGGGGTMPDGSVKPSFTQAAGDMFAKNKDWSPKEKRTNLQLLAGSYPVKEASDGMTMFNKIETHAPDPKPDKVGTAFGAKGHSYTSIGMKELLKDVNTDTKVAVGTYFDELNSNGYTLDGGTSGGGKRSLTPAGVRAYESYQTKELEKRDYWAFRNDPERGGKVFKTFAKDFMKNNRSKKSYWKQTK